MGYPLDPNYFIHENDRKALDALKGIPGFNQLIKAFMKVFNERSMHILNMSGKVRLSEKQCPRIYNLLPPICERLCIPVPELYLEMDRSPNAYTSGDTNIFITVTTGLLETMNDDEIQTVLAHECGHILCHHVLYHTVGTVILNGAAALLGLGGLATVALQVAFSYWMRCSEFSADRVAALFCEGPERVVSVMTRLAGGFRDISIEINEEEFMKQAAEYADYVSDSKWNKVLECLALMNATHPFLAVRAASITEWCKSDVFKNASEYMATGAFPGGQIPAGLYLSGPNQNGPYPGGTYNGGPNPGGPTPGGPYTGGPNPGGGYQGGPYQYGGYQGGTYQYGGYRSPYQGGAYNSPYQGGGYQNNGYQGWYDPNAAYRNPPQQSFPQPGAPTPQPGIPAAQPNGTQPEAPAYGTQPEAPAYGTQPEAPAYSTQPEAPAYGTQPEAPAYGTQPEAPAYGTQPEAPAYGAQPEAPAYGAQTEDPAFGEPAAPSAEPTVCPQCGAQIMKGRPFCPECGSRLSDVQ